MPQGSEYASISEYNRVGNILEFLNMPGLHKDLNEMFHDNILNTPWSYEYACVTQGSVENGSNSLNMQ